MSYSKKEQLNEVVERLFQECGRLERQNEDTIRAIQTGDGMDFYSLPDGRKVSTFPEGSKIPPQTPDLEVILSRDLGGNTWAAITLTPEPRIVASGWQELRHLFGPYFVASREGDGAELLINVNTGVVMRKCLY